MQYAAENSFPRRRTRWQVANIFFADVMNADDEFLDKAWRTGVVRLQQGRSLHLPSRALIQESIYDKFMERCLARIAKITKATLGHDDDDRTTSLHSTVAKDRVYVEIGKQEGAEVLIGGEPTHVGGELEAAITSSHRVEGHNKMRVFQEEISAVLAVTTFKDEAEALEIATIPVRTWRRRVDSRR